MSTLPPVDEALAEPELVAYRDKVLAAVRARDWPALQDLMYYRIGFGPDYQDAKRRLLGDFWGMPSVDSPLWWKLERALTWGSRFNPGRVLVSPGLDLAWPAGLDRERHLVAGPDVPFYAEPSPNTPVVARLHHDVVALVDGSFAGYDWHTNREDHSGGVFYHVRTADGRTGHVFHRDLASPLEHQAYIAKVEDRWWQLVAFVSPPA